MIRRYAWTIAAVVVFLAILFGSTVVTLYTDWLWFKDLGFTVVFTKTLLTQIELGLAFGMAFFLIVYANLWLARYIAPPPTMRIGYEERLGERFGKMAKGLLGVLLFVGTLVVATMVGIEASTHWDDFLRFTNASPFTLTDPVFHRNIGFYVFRLPFLRYLYGWLFFAFLAAAVATFALHYADEKIEFVMSRPQFAPNVKTHLLSLVAVLFFLKGWGYYLDRFGVLTTPNDMFYGAGYTDMHARLPAFWVLMVVSIIGGILVLLNIRRRGIGIAAAALILVIATSFLLGTVYPNAVQQFAVKPNELRLQTPYIKEAIRFTRDSYKVSQVNNREYPVSAALNAAGLAENQPTVQNVRLWDYRPLTDVYRQIQSIQQYYTFEDVDVDRYTLNGRYQQVMLSARELAQDQLNPDAQTWVNHHLVYTHGYGIVMSPVSQVSDEGLPVLYVRDMPPAKTVDLQLTRPEIYFGEKTDQYVFVKTKAQEFDYPAGDQEISTKYEGNGGVPVGSFFRRVMLALRFSDVNLLLNSDVLPTSRVLFRRNIRDRATALLPFLVFDKDPYLVVSKGKLYWFQDAYTLNDNYPYAHMANYSFDNGDYTFNYIRNAVKVVTDAYTGEVKAYAADAQDPIIRTYAKIYPGTIRPLSEMPPDLRTHIRYPEDLFNMQSRVLTTYHVTSPRVFFMRQDQWMIPSIPSTVGNESVDTDGNRKRMDANYLIMRLPGGTSEEMIILTPFIRADRNNMVAWFCAKNDPNDYGRLVLFDFPEGQNVYGPAQISARINQDPRISQLFTLWNQAGSRVRRGNLLVIPVQGTMLYVEPLYLESTETKIPELKRVVVAVGNTISMEDNLGAALTQVVGAPATAPEASGATTAASPGTPEPEVTQPPATGPVSSRIPLSPEVRRLITKANDQFEEAERRQKAGDWAGYGRQIDELKKTLKELGEASQSR